MVDISIDTSKVSLIVSISISISIFTTQSSPHAKVVGNWYTAKLLMKQQVFRHCYTGDLLKVP